MRSDKVLSTSKMLETALVRLVSILSVLALSKEHGQDDHLGKIHKCEHDKHVKKEELRLE